MLHPCDHKSSLKLKELLKSFSVLNFHTYNRYCQIGVSFKCHHQMQKENFTANTKEQDTAEIRKHRQGFKEITLKNFCI